MRSRVVGALLVAMAVAACGGRSLPTQPSVPIAQPTGTIESGAYRLMVTMSTTGDTVCNGAGCFSMSLCVSVAGAPLIGVIVPLDVHVERTGNAITVRADDPSATFRMDLQLSGASLAGTASGAYQSGGIAVTVSGGTLDAPATVTGVTAPSVGGTLDGSIMIGGSGCSNNGHHWSLGPRLP